MKFRPFFFLLLFLVFPVTACLSQNFRVDTIRVYFDLNKTELKEKSLKTLDSLVGIMNKYKKEKLSLTGYADYLGKDDHNHSLSDDRARNVRNYLVEHGVDSSRIQYYVGKGAIEPQIKNLNHNGIPAHRRVDIIAARPVAPPAAVKTKEKFDTKKLKKDDKIVLDNIYFEPGMHIIRTISFPEISELVKILKSNPGLKIEIQGHICCDSVSDDGYDLQTNRNELSVNRAKAVYEQLVHYGVDSTRLRYKGFGGKRRLIKDERTTEDQMRNRRVEIMILETGEAVKKQ